MITAADLRALALALPGASESPHFDRASFRANKKIFVTLTADGTEAMVKLPDPELVGALLTTEPEVYFSYGAWTANGGATGVRLAQVDPARMAELVRLAWAGVQPAPRKRASGG